MIAIYISNRQKALKINKSLITKVLKSILSQEGYRNISVSLSIVNNREIKRLNRQYLARNNITDVISFPLSDLPLLSQSNKTRKKTSVERNTQQSKFSVSPGDNLIGEIVVSAQKALSEARKRHIPPTKELLLYCIHGLLHLLGYDDTTKKKRSIMERKQEMLLKKIYPS